MEPILMRFNNFVFPNNPEKCSIECERNIAKHKYYGNDGEELEDLHPDAAIVSGSGTFFGEGAFRTWEGLLDVYRKGGVAQLIHPFFPLEKAMFKKLRGEVEPGDGSVSFEFEFWEHIEPIRRLEAVKGVSLSASSISSKNPIKHKVVKGDTLWQLAERYLKNSKRWTEIANDNKIKDPKKLQIGKVLVINV